MPYKDPAAKLAHDAAYRAARRSELAAMQRDYYYRNREWLMECSVRYTKTHPELKRAIDFANASNRRARKYGAPGKLFGRDVKHITGPCAYCAGEAEGWDHVVALSRGGHNTLDNLRRCCLGCNRRKALRDGSWRP